MEENKSARRGGISFLGLLTIVFIVLKLTGVINWSWLWVTVLLWGPLAAVVVVWVVCALIIGAYEIYQEIKK